MGERVTVVGAGMVGLTCAVQLAEAGHQVNVLARDLPGETASSLAAAPWLPPPVRLGEAVAEWARTTREVLTSIADGGRPGTSIGDTSVRGTDVGVRMATGRLVRADLISTDLISTDLISTDLISTDPNGNDRTADSAQQVDQPVVVPVPYLRWLTRRLMRAGGTLTRMALPVLPRPQPDAGYVVNCTGVAARALVPDPLVVPRTRRVVRLVDPGLVGWTALVDAGGECRLLIVPDGGSVTVTGDDSPGAELVAQAAAVEPRLSTARLLGERTAVRAERDQVRVGPDGDSAPADRLLHNYGHGAAGLSLSWGSARAVQALLSQ